MVITPLFCVSILKRDKEFVKVVFGPNNEVAWILKIVYVNFVYKSGSITIYCDPKSTEFVLPFPRISFAPIPIFSSTYPSLFC